MPFLHSLRQHLKESSEVHLRVRREAGQLSIVVIPKLIEVQPDPTDETVAQFHAALSRPFHLSIPDADDPDHTLAGVLATVVETHSETLSDLQRYQQDVEAARVKAKDDAARKQLEAAAKSASKPAAKKPASKGADKDQGKKPTKPTPATKAEAKPAPVPREKAPIPAPTVPPPPAPISDLFGGLPLGMGEPLPAASHARDEVEEAEHYD